MDTRIRKMLAEIDGCAKRLDTRDFARKLDEAPQKVWRRMMDLIANPPEGYHIEEDEGTNYTIIVRRIDESD